MNKFTRIAFAAALLGGAPAFAFDDTDRAAVKTTFDTLTTGLAENDYDAVFSTMSPAILAKMAEPTGMAPEAFQALAAEQMKAAMEQVEIKSVSYDLDGMTTDATSTGRDYAVVSTTTVMEMGGTAVQAVGPALAYEDGDKWYVIQIQSPEQAAVLASVYPDLAEVELPEGEMTAVE